ncbi:MAG: hypothetical protein P8P99_01315 [Maricaulis sp.]|nr:hypothetical protein [Maricaulis sp.]
MLPLNDQVARRLIPAFEFYREAAIDKLTVIFPIEYGVAKIASGRLECIDGY